MSSLLIQPIWRNTPFPIAIIGFDRVPKDRRLIYVNPAFVKMTGYSNEEACGKPAALLDGPSSNPILVEECEAALSKGEPFTRPARHYRKDGSVFLSQFTLAPLLESDGRAAFLISMDVETHAPSDGRAPCYVGHGPTFVPLTLPMPLKEVSSGELPKHLSSHPELTALRDLWISMAADGETPRRSKLGLQVLKRWASHLSIAAVLPAGRFQFSLFGTELERVYGRDLTNCYLDELSPANLWSVVRLHYETVTRTREPLFAPISISNGRWYSEVSRLLMPLASDDGAVAFIMGADYSRASI
jgi:PAS domain S-box-containing protein